MRRAKLAKAVIVARCQEFLALPNEALPNADFVDGFDDLDASKAWDFVRAAAQGDVTDLVVYGPVRLVADRDVWCKGVTLP